MSIPKKPIKNEDTFISGAKLEEKNDMETKNQNKSKKLLIEIEYDLWKRLKIKALQNGITLKDLIVNILKDNST